jgi:hypothetical protein
MLTAEGTRPKSAGGGGKRATLDHREEQFDAVAVEIHSAHLSPKLKASDFFCHAY